jgi:ATP-dependent Clp protease protease subunit
MSKIIRDDITHFFDHDIHVPTRTVYLGSAESSIEHGESGVDTVMAERLMKSLHILDKVSDAPITIIMNNAGGDFIHGMAIYDAIKTCQNHVTIRVFGHAMSMGSVILQAADERILAPNAKIMIHYGVVGLGEQHAKTVYRWADEYKKYDQWMEQVFLDKIQEKHPTFSAQKVRRMLEFDTFLSASQAVQIGLADSILKKNHA